MQIIYIFLSLCVLPLLSCSKRKNTELKDARIMNFIHMEVLSHGLKQGSWSDEINWKSLDKAFADDKRYEQLKSQLLIKGSFKYMPNKADQFELRDNKRFFYSDKNKEYLLLSWKSKLHKIECTNFGEITIKPNE